MRLTTDRARPRSSLRRATRSSPSRSGSRCCPPSRLGSGASRARGSRPPPPSWPPARAGPPGGRGRDADPALRPAGDERVPKPAAGARGRAVKPTTGAAVQEALGRVGDAAVLERAETLRGVVTTIVSAYEVATQARDLEIARLRALLSARDRQDQA